MKGVILAGGVGSRLLPITKVINKNLLPIYDKPTILYPIEAFVKAGVVEIAIIAEDKHLDGLKKVLGEYSGDFMLTYIADDHVKKGPAQALYYAKEFVANDNVIVAFADNNFDYDLSNDVKTFSHGAKVFLKRVENPSQFGVVELDSKGKIIGLHEKPKNPKSDMIVTGISMYDKDVFGYIENVKPGIKGEYYLVDVNVMYMKKGELSYSLLDGFWSDTGTFDGLARSTSYWFNKAKLS